MPDLTPGPNAIVRTMLTPLDANGMPQPHPPDYHAEITAEKIIQVAETASPELQRAGRDLRKKVEAILTTHHGYVHEDEVEALKKHGVSRLDHDLDATPHIVPELMSAIIEASRGTILESHFARPDVQAVIEQELHHETRSQMQVHRQTFQAREKLSRKGR